MLREIHVLGGCEIPTFCAPNRNFCPLTVHFGLSMLLSLFFFSIFHIFSKYLRFLLQDVEFSWWSVKKYKMPVLKRVRVTTGLQICMVFFFFWVCSIGGVLTSLSYLYWWGPKWEVLWTWAVVAVQPCEKMLSYWKIQVQYFNCCSGCSNYRFDLRVSVAVWQTVGQTEGLEILWALGCCACWVGKQCLKWTHWQEMYSCSHKSPCTLPGQPHQWDQKVAQWEA